MSDPCFVYFVQAGDNGNIKIGISRNPERRLTKMRTDAPVELNVLGVVVGDKAKERDLHRELSEHRANREWFSPHADVLAVVEREKSAGNVEYLAPRRKWVPKCPLEAWRRKQGMTVVELGNLIGLAQATISQIENGRHRPRWDVLETIYRVTDGEVSPNDFLSSKLAAFQAKRSA